MELAFKETQRGALSVLSVAGEVDLACSPQLGRRLHECIGAYEDRFVIDLTGVTFMDSTGLGTLASGARALAPKGMRLSVVTAQPSLQRIFEITAMRQILDIYQTLDDVPGVGE